MGLRHTRTIQKCFKRCRFQAGNEGEDGRFTSFLYVCAGVTNCQKFAFLLNNKMLVTVIHYFIIFTVIHYSLFLIIIIHTQEIKDVV